MADVDLAQLRIEFRGLHQRPVARGQQNAPMATVYQWSPPPKISAAAVIQLAIAKRTLGSRQQNRLGEGAMYRAYALLFFDHRPDALKERSTQGEERGHQLGCAERARTAEGERGHFAHAGAMFAHRPHDAGTDDGRGGDRMSDRTLQIVLQRGQRTVPRQRATGRDRGECLRRPGDGDDSKRIAESRC